MSEVIISVENLSKRYVLGAVGRSNERYTSLRDVIARKAGALLKKNSPSNEGPKTDFWALNEVSFDISQGEVVGIIGRNGAGKSTLLKILSRITDPTAGRIKIKGRVASLLEVGTGFHPELTGRENIYLNGAILGMSRAEIKNKFDEIVSFAEVEAFLDTPVKRYSSGMYVRLAFAVAAHLEPEILVVDEVLAVGDLEFQKKCLGKMQSVSKSEGRTVLFVSHNMGAINTLCHRAIYLASGRVREIGPVGPVISTYYNTLRAGEDVDLNTLRLPGYTKEVHFTKIAMRSNHADGNSDINFGQDLVYELEVRATAATKGLSIGSSLFNQTGDCIASLLTEGSFSMVAGQTTALRLTIRKVSLAPGRYYAGCSVGFGGRGSVRRDLDVVVGLPSFEILPVAKGEDAFISNWSSSWGSIVMRDFSLEIESSSS